MIKTFSTNAIGLNLSICLKVRSHSPKFQVWLSPAFFSPVYASEFRQRLLVKKEIHLIQLMFQFQKSAWQKYNFEHSEINLCLTRYIHTLQIQVSESTNKPNTLLLNQALSSSCFLYFFGSCPFRSKQHGVFWTAVP